MDNVVQFPKHKKGTPPQSIADITANINMFRQEYITELTMAIFQQSMDMFELNGILIDDTTNYDKEVAIMIEALTSILYKYFKMDYENSDAIDKIIELQISEAGEYSYKFNVPTIQE